MLRSEIDAIQAALAEGVARQAAAKRMGACQHKRKRKVGVK